MTEPILLNRSGSVSLVVLLQVVMPPLVVAGTLYAICSTYDTVFSGFFQVLAASAAALTVLLPRGRPQDSTQLAGASLPLAARVILRWLVIVAVLLGIGYVTKYSGTYSRRIVLTWVGVTPLVLVAVSLALQELMRRVLYDPSVARRVAFVGCNEVSLALARRIQSNADLGLAVQGFFDDRSCERLGVSGQVRVLGSLCDIASAVRRRGIDVIFVALPMRHIRRVVDLLDKLRDTTVSVYYVPDIFVFDLIQARTGELLGIPVVALCETPFCGYRGVVKRITDIALAAVLLVLGAPLMLAIALAVALSSGRPVLFKQRRYGLDGEEIIVYKFRTMSVVEDGASILQAHKEDARVTRVGRFLRRHSLDELPQLINVLQGRMSLVGPRPHAIAHNEEYRKLIKGYMMRHKVHPGITGLAQINGFRGETVRVEDMRARVEYDLEYLRRWTPLLDFKILVLTAVRLLRDEKAY
ncbi:MAG: undecaprenyl-phosphate glucose phosphotransferase [Steroidobacteraceae bacterium]